MLVLKLKVSDSQKCYILQFISEKQKKALNKGKNNNKLKAQTKIIIHVWEWYAQSKHQKEFKRSADSWWLDSELVCAFWDSRFFLTWHVIDLTQGKKNIEFCTLSKINTATNTAISLMASMGLDSEVVIYCFCACVWETFSSFIYIITPVLWHSFYSLDLHHTTALDNPFIANDFVSVKNNNSLLDMDVNRWNIKCTNDKANKTPGLGAEALQGRSDSSECKSRSRRTGSEELHPNDFKCTQAIIPYFSQEYQFFHLPINQQLYIIDLAAQW